MGCDLRYISKCLFWGILCSRSLSYTDYGLKTKTGAWFLKLSMTIQFFFIGNVISAFNNKCLGDTLGKMEQIMMPMISIS